MALQNNRKLQFCSCLPTKSLTGQFIPPIPKSIHYSSSKELRKYAGKMFQNNEKRNGGRFSPTLNDFQMSWAWVHAELQDNPTAYFPQAASTQHGSSQEDPVLEWQHLQDLISKDYPDVVNTKEKETKDESNINLLTLFVPTDNENLNDAYNNILAINSIVHDFEMSGIEFTDNMQDECIAALESQSIPLDHVELENPILEDINLFHPICLEEIPDMNSIEEDMKNMEFTGLDVDDGHIEIEDIDFEQLKKSKLAMDNSIDQEYFKNFGRKRKYGLNSVRRW